MNKPQTRQQAWYWRNVERERERTRQYRENNREACRKRCREYMQRRRVADPELYRGWQIARYGITVERYWELFKKQQGLCAICHLPETRKKRDGTPKDLSIDHNHETTVVRGLLCARCNSALGWFEKLGSQAIEYLGTNWVQTGR